MVGDHEVEILQPRLDAMGAKLPVVGAGDVVPAFGQHHPNDLTTDGAVIDVKDAQRLVGRCGTRGIFLTQRGEFGKAGLSG